MSSLPDPVGQSLLTLVRQYGLPAAAAEGLAAHVLLLSQENANTSVSEPSRAVGVHVADSLVALELPEVRAASVIADMGSGAGFPGLPLALALPGAQVHLLETTGRFAAFLREAAVAAGAANVEVHHTRVEEWAAGLGTCDVVTARALAPLAVLAEYAAPLLKPRGALVAWKAKSNPEEEAAAAKAAEILGLQRDRVIQVPPRPGADHRTLHVYSKVTETPSGFPRRPGMARKRPL